MTRRGLRRAAAIAAVTALAGCGAPAVSSVRFANQPPVWQVNDRRDVARPANRPFSRLLYFFDAFLYGRIDAALALEAPRHAIGVNAVDEVPDSTWFTNRIGVRELTAEEVARGPAVHGGPAPPYTVTGTKVGGRSTGFLIEDARGARYILKFDERGIPMMETAADVIVERLLWALGYNVPEDSIVLFERADLRLAAGAEVKDTFGNTRPMREADLAASLAKVDIGRDARYRALASKLLPGVPIGGFPQSGVRDDDPNDVIPHQHRREVRGLYVIFSWLQATDVKVDNTLDVWVPDPADPDHHYVVHYLVDFGKSLGANGSIPAYAPDGHAPRVAYGTSLRSLFSFGLWRRPWEGTADPAIQGVGRIDVDHFEPGGFSPQQPYRPFDFVDRHDGLWAAKLVMRLTPAQLRAAVEQGRFPDSRAVDYLTGVLVGRQRKLARYWFRKTAPLDRFELAAGGRLCFADLLLTHRLASAGEARTRWQLATFDRSGRATGWTGEARATGSPGRACADRVPLAGGDGYTIVRIETRRAASSPPPVELHLGRRDGRPVVLGLVRR